MNPLIKPIKKALAAKFGHKNVSVKNGQGTAWGWVEVRVYSPKHADDMPREEELAIEADARAIAYKAVHEAGLKFHTYCSDDGYNSERDCVLVSAFPLNYKY